MLKLKPMNIGYDYPGLPRTGKCPLKGVKFPAEDLRMLRSSVAVMAGASLLSAVLLAQSSQPSGNQPSPSQSPPAVQVQPPAQQGPPAGPAIDSLKSQSPERKQPRAFRIIVVPKKQPKALPIGILDKATPA
jgi:hypothetical protein